jgi:hypothetical protein
MNDPDKTRIVRRPINITSPEQSDSSLPLPTEDRPTRVLRRDEAAASDDPTRKVGSSSDEDKTVLNRPDDGKTVLIRPGKSGGDKTSFHPMAPAAAASSSSEESEPVVGWLVVLKGPGRGKAVALGYGWNTIGRDASQRARLDFGDSQISRLNHAKLLYDPKSRKFTLTLGESPNPTYIRDEVVLGPTKLENGDKIQLGDTTVLFHSLCGENFDWQDLE